MELKVWAAKVRSYWKIKLWAKIINHFDVFDNLWSRKTQCDHSTADKYIPALTSHSVNKSIIQFNMTVNDHYTLLQIWANSWKQELDRSTLPVRGYIVHTPSTRGGGGGGGTNPPIISKTGSLELSMRGRKLVELMISNSFQISMATDLIKGVLRQIFLENDWK